MSADDKLLRLLPLPLGLDVGRWMLDVSVVQRAGVRGCSVLRHHEAAQPQATVQLADLGFRIKRLVDIESGEPVPFRSSSGGIEFPITAAFGSTRLLRVSP